MSSPIPSYWEKHPIMRHELNQENEKGSEVKHKEEVSFWNQEEATFLPESFQWSELDVKNTTELDEIYNLLSDNYVTDPTNNFQLYYSRDILQWALDRPGFHLFLGIRIQKNRKLVAFVSSNAQWIRVHGKRMQAVIIDFLYILPKLREKRLTPVLIQEVSRRIFRANKGEIQQAIYTAGKLLTAPLSKCQYFHRLLNVKKLVQTGFTCLLPFEKLSRKIKYYRLIDKKEKEEPNPLQILEEKHLEEAFHQCNRELNMLDLHPIFDKKTFRAHFLPRENVVYSFVITNPKTGSVTDFISYFSIYTKVKSQNEILKAAQLYYYFNTSVSLEKLLFYALCKAKESAYDVFNVISMFKLGIDTLSRLKFSAGTGSLYYYMYNWKCRPIESNHLQLVLI